MNINKNSFYPNSENYFQKKFQVIKIRNSFLDSLSFSSFFFFFFHHPLWTPPLPTLLLLLFFLKKLNNTCFSHTLSFNYFSSGRVCGCSYFAIEFRFPNSLVLVISFHFEMENLRRFLQSSYGLDFPGDLMGGLEKQPFSGNPFPCLRKKKEKNPLLMGVKWKGGNNKKTNVTLIYFLSRGKGKRGGNAAEVENNDLIENDANQLKFKRLTFYWIFLV